MTTTTNDTARDARMAVRGAVMNLSAHPEAMRWWVQLGLLPKGIGLIEKRATETDSLVADGVLDADEAQLLVEIRDRIAALKGDGGDFLREAESKQREYLFSDALESPEWSELRVVARRLFAQLSEGLPERF